MSQGILNESAPGFGKVCCLDYETIFIAIFFLSATIYLYNLLYPNLRGVESKEAVEGASRYTDLTRPRKCYGIILRFFSLLVTF